VKNGPPLGFPTTNKLSVSGDFACLTARAGALPLDPAGGSAPDPRAFPSSKFAIIPLAALVVKSVFHAHIIRYRSIYWQRCSDRRQWENI